MIISIGSGIKIEASTELVLKVRSVLKMIKDTNKIELEYDKYLIRFWMADHGNGKKVLSIQVEEVS
jgi:hypothetical protein